MTGQRGYSLVELLVSLAIILILLALLIPAILAMREASRKVTCASHLRQYGLALHNYHDVMGQLPPGAIHAHGPDYDPEVDGRGRSEHWRSTWILSSLSFLEADAASHLADFQGTLTSTESMRKLVASKQGAMICPTNGPSQPLITPGEFAKGNYAACFGGYDQFHTADAEDPAYRAAFSAIGQRGSSFAEITDGLSNTIYLGEVLTLDSGLDGRGTWAHPAGCGFVAELGRLTPNADAWNDPLRYSDSPAYCDPDYYGYHRKSCIQGLDGVDANIGLRSYHSEGAMAGLADGSTIFLKDRIDPKLYQQIITIAGRESVDMSETR